MRGQRTLITVEVYGAIHGIDGGGGVGGTVHSGAAAFREDRGDQQMARGLDAEVEPMESGPILHRVRCKGLALPQRQSSAGATWVRMVSITCALYATPNWLGTVSSRVSASAMASSCANCAISRSGSAA